MSLSDAKLPRLGEKLEADAEVVRSKLEDKDLKTKKIIKKSAHKK